MKHTMLIDLDEETLKKVDELAVQESRKRKPMVELIIKKYFSTD